MDEKLINEDIQNMKYLFGYKPGRVISEQDYDYTTDYYLDTTEDNDDEYFDDEYFDDEDNDNEDLEDFDKWSKKLPDMTYKPKHSQSLTDEDGMPW